MSGFLFSFYLELLQVQHLLNSYSVLVIELGLEEITMNWRSMSTTFTVQWRRPSPLTGCFYALVLSAPLYQVPCEQRGCILQSGRFWRLSKEVTPGLDFDGWVEFRGWMNNEFNMWKYFSTWRINIRWSVNTDFIKVFLSHVWPDSFLHQSFLSSVNCLCSWQNAIAIKEPVVTFHCNHSSLYWTPIAGKMYIF